MTRCWRTSEEWRVLIGDLGVRDPDGWDRANFRYSFHQERITAQEYINRCGRSSCDLRVLLEDDAPDYPSVSKEPGDLVQRRSRE